MRTSAASDGHGGAGDVSSPELRVRLLGELGLDLGDRRLAALESARARSLLGYLLLHDDVPHARQRLAFMLWPESTETQARTNLRKTLHILRREAPEVAQALEVTPRTIAWRPDVACWVDVAAFRHELQRADAEETGSDDAVAALQAAVHLYSGDLLEGCYDDWVVDERERLRERYVAALWNLGEALADRGDRVGALHLGHQVLRCDPFREDVYRFLMRIHNAAGDRAAAVRVYHECVTTLQRELGVDPARATTQAYARLVHAEQAEAEPPPPVAPAGGTALVGRGHEWARLAAAWRDAEGGRSRLVAVTGEAGVGKTRLVEELAGWCAHRGAVVARARSYPTEGELGYGVAISWLRAGEVANRLRRAPSFDVAELTRLLPELGGRVENRPDAGDEAEQRRRLFEAVARTLATSSRPTMLVADDAQWADSQSLKLIHYLVRSDDHGPLLIVATARGEELEGDHPLRGIIAGLRILDRTTEIALDRLTRSDTATLARLLAPGELAAEHVDALYAETEGNPLFVVEAVRSGWDLTSGQGSALTPKLQAVIGSRLRSLSDPARALVGVAATIGRAFTAELLAAASDLEEAAVVRGLDELWRRGVVSEHGADAYDFAHGKIRDVAHELLGPAARRRNHLLVAGALRNVHAADLDAVSGQLARHYDAAGRHSQAVMWYQRAAVRAQRLHANSEAVRLLDRAGEVVDALPASDARLRRELEVLSALPTPLAGAEGFASPRLARTQRRAVELARLLDVEPEPPVLRSLAMSNLCANDFDQAWGVADQLRLTAERAGDEGLLVESEYLLGIAAFWGGAFSSARTHFEQAIGRFNDAQRNEHLVRFGHDPRIVCLSRLGNTLWFLGLGDEARRSRDRAVALATALGHPYSRGVTHVFAALLATDMEDGAGVRTHASALGRDRDQARPNEIMAGAVLGLAAVLEGDPTGGIARVRSAIEAAGPVNHAPGFRAALLRLLVGAHAAAGDADGGLAAADAALGLDGSRIWEAELRRLRATFLATTGGTRAEVEAELLRAAGVARSQGAAGLQRRIDQSRSLLASGG